MTFTYENAIKELVSQGKFYINLGLERISKILELCDNPHKILKCIHVAGTNGKGSVCAMLSSVLSQKYKVGLYTSPHIFEYNERIKINNENISKEDFAVYTEKIFKLANYNKIHLTEFEVLTAAAFCYFFDKNVDIAVIEVGLGGRLDATNVIENPLCSVITHLDLEHTERLGKTIEEITFEKCGILKKNCPAVVYKDSQVLDLIEKTAKDKNAILHTAIPVKDSYELALKGTFQKENLSLVIKTLEVLPYEISDDEIKSGLKNVKHACRFEYIKDEKLLIDGAHNPNSAKLLRESLDEYFPNQNYKFIFGCLKHKDYAQMSEFLFKEHDEVYFYKFSNPNAASINDIRVVCHNEIKDFSEFKHDKSKLTVICGSFYMIKELLSELGIKRK